MRSIREVRGVRVHGGGPQLVMRHILRLRQHASVQTKIVRRYDAPGRKPVYQ